MDLTTELLDNAAFREAKRGGYNTQDVDDFIEQVKLEYQRHSALLRDLTKRVEGADARVAEAERRAAEAAERASSTSDADDTLKRTLVLAQRTADAAIREAEEHAARTLASAQDEAAQMLAEAQETSTRARAEAEGDARRAQEEARTKVLGELRDLEAARDQLHADVANLERHLDEQRDRLRHATRELQRLLDDPAALRPASVPVVSEVVVPNTSAPAPAPARREPVSARPRPRVEEDPAAWTPDDEAWSEPEAPATPAASGRSEPGSRLRAAPAGRSRPAAADMMSSHDPGDDAYLAELRKAMTDDSPLGPREEGDFDPLYDAGAEPSRTRFGRRR